MSLENLPLQTPESRHLLTILTQIPVKNFCAKCYQVTIFTMYSNYEKLRDCVIMYFNYMI